MGDLRGGCDDLPDLTAGEVDGVVVREAEAGVTVDEGVTGGTTSEGGECVVVA